MDTLALLEGLRFLDSFFPSGGYAFSSGLEAAVQAGALTNGEGLSRYVEDLLRGGLGKREAVAVREAHDALVSNDLARALTIDRDLDAMKIGRDSRLASRQMGRQVIRISAEHMPVCKLLRQFQAKVETGHAFGHHAVAMGLTLAACEWPRRETVAGYLYHNAVGLVSAAMKLLPVGQREAQNLLHRWTAVIDKLSEEVLLSGHMSFWSPVQDIYAMRHHRLESRLFRS
ncbi:putative urease accessory protein UreF [Nitrospira sp. KM1]|uniref:urease accessory protein UreF n=1 Tax=Nitrospira sp. KM1 TaxID=1936990 RepID=UPI0013A74CFD|nr:urease accessory UreF family protein [Nitrospira sp. KM1]BCA56783.1 putative urease accessory protein UreF [Nitrospira sp. KM1]